MTRCSLTPCPCEPTRCVAVEGLSPELLQTQPSIPWRAIARLRDHLAHRYFDTDRAIVEDVVGNELDRLLDAANTLLEQVESLPDDKS